MTADGNDTYHTIYAVIRRLPEGSVATSGQIARLAGSGGHARMVGDALCGFAHFASMAIFVGGFSALAPSRTKDLAAVGFRALLAATLATLMTGAVAGVVFNNSTILSGI